LQGPCKIGKWLISNSSLGIEDAVTCESVPDKECKIDGSEIFYKGRCRELYSFSDACGCRNYIVRDKDDLGIAKCTPYLILPHATLSGKVPKFSCPPGSRRALGNQCKLIYKYGTGKLKNFR